MTANMKIFINKLLNNGFKYEEGYCSDDGNMVTLRGATPYLNLTQVVTILFNDDLSYTIYWGLCDPYIDRIVSQSSYTGSGNRCIAKLEDSIIW